MGRRLKNGSVWVNCYQMMDPAVPFGGYKMSGYGRESGSLQTLGSICLRLAMSLAAHTAQWDSCVSGSTASATQS